MTIKDDETVELLVFRLADIYCAVESCQVEGLYDLQTVSAEKLLFIGQLLGFGGQKVEYTRPTVIRLKDGGYAGEMIVIDALEDISSYSLGLLSPLPLLVNQYVNNNGFWGVVRCSQGRLIFIIDLYVAVSNYKPGKSSPRNNVA